MQGRFKFIFFLIAVFFSCSVTFAQQKDQPQDSLVRLIEASSAKLQEIDGVSYRIVIGPARFLHNNTYLLCDTAIWNVNTNIINAVGNVQVIQENTFLTSDKIDYIINENLAQFRGSLVELFDKEGNILRTNYLDYNTKDSIGTFYSGGAMRNVDGNLIESNNGEYRSVDKMFSFIGNVQMFTDSVFIKSSRVDYNTVSNKAIFGKNTTAWQEDNMLYANDGEFDRPEDILHFKRDSYILTKDQELWADTLTYYKTTGVAELYNNIQILDTVQHTYCFADKAVYTPEPFNVILTEKPSVAMYTLENGVRDTVFMAADTLKYYTVPYCCIDSTIVAQAKARRELSAVDPLAKIEETAASAREKNEESAGRTVEPKAAVPKSNEGTLSKIAPPGKGGEASNDYLVDFLSDTLTKVESNNLLAVPDSLSISTDSLKIGKDSLKSGADSLIVADSTAIAFIDAWHNVKIFRSDIQALCDSLVYTAIDSIARLYIKPVMWYSGKHQFTSDSMQLVVENNVLSKANLITNAFMASQEDTVHYNQIKGAEMIAYFKDNDIYRYDALGGASMIFYLQEDSIITIMNRKEGKILSARIKDREIQRIKYIENLKNDALPVFNLSVEDQRLKGFNWRGNERPVSRYEVVDRVIKGSRRASLLSTPFPDYPNSEIYFADTRDAALRYKATSDSLRIARAIAKIRARELEKAKQDSLAKEMEHINQDSLLAVTDSLDKSDIDSLSVADSLKGLPDVDMQLAEYNRQDSLYTAMVDSLNLKLIPKKEISALPKDERRLVKKAQTAIRKEIRQTEKLQAKLRKKIRKMEKQKK